MTNQEEIQDAIEWIEGLRNGWNDEDNIKYCNMAIKTLEQTKWIPVSERLPKEGVEVLVCFELKKTRYVCVAEMFRDRTFHGYDDEYLTPEGRTRKAIAWMPLPKPYKEAEE